jgi:hypothetical protein
MGPRLAGMQGANMLKTFSLKEGLQQLLPAETTALQRVVEILQAARILFQ